MHFQLSLSMWCDLSPQVLEEVAENPAPLLQPCMHQVLEMCMVVATRKDFASNTREQGLALLHWMAK
jgi:hypothetical protein